MPTKGQRNFLHCWGWRTECITSQVSFQAVNQQRVALARALINDPAILLADEPTGNLDSKTGCEILNMFTRLNEDGRTIVMITHDPEIARYADRIVLVKDGIIQSNTD